MRGITNTFVQDYRRIFPSWIQRHELDRRKPHWPFALAAFYQERRGLAELRGSPDDLVCGYLCASGGATFMPSFLETAVKNLIEMRNDEVEMRVLLRCTEVQ